MNHQLTAHSVRPAACGPRPIAISRFTLHVSLLALGAVVFVPRTASSQETWDPTRVYASRSGLDSLAHRFELAAESPAYSEVLRAEARSEASALRTRLKEGDFQVGDRIVLSVEREQAYSDSFTVEQGPAIQLPTVGRLSLAGVLRSELEGHLTQELGKFIRDPVVRARSSIRISVTGEVKQPGFYAVPSELLVTDILAQAGQVTTNADLGKIRIERAGRTIWDSETLGPEIIEGRTLDQLGVRAGDRVVVGSRPRGLGAFYSSTQTLFLILSLPAAIGGLIALFGG
jgi:protein involved in polysaccharide export with SLBB domain